MANKKWRENIKEKAPKYELNNLRGKSGKKEAEKESDKTENRCELGQYKNIKIGKKRMIDENRGKGGKV